MAARRHFVQGALARGYRFGLVAGTESHDGRPGNPMYHGPHRCGEDVCYHGGIQGVYAEALEPEALFEAFRARRCYGTTGVRIGLQLEVNGAPMVSEVRAAGEREVCVRVSGTDTLDRTDVVRNNEDVHTVRPATLRHELRWVDRRSVEDRDFYYVRVTQWDGNMAWSSPIWVG